MVFRRSPKLVLFLLLVTSSFPALAQIAPAARENHIPIAVGVGVSDFSLDWGSGRRMEGMTAWFDWMVPGLPGPLRGFGIELEGRDINFNRPSVIPRMRQDTAEGGPIYVYRHYRRIHPYAKYLVGFGSIDFGPFPGAPPTYTHDTRTVLVPGLGVEYKAFKNVWVRADYEYEFWPKLFGPHALNPNGFTFGAMYDFNNIGGR